MRLLFLQQAACCCFCASPLGFADQKWSRRSVSVLLLFPARRDVRSSGPVRRDEQRQCHGHLILQRDQTSPLLSRSPVCWPGGEIVGSFLFRKSSLWWFAYRLSVCGFPWCLPLWDLNESDGLSQFVCTCSIIGWYWTFFTFLTTLGRMTEHCFEKKKNVWNWSGSSSEIFFQMLFQAYSHISIILVVKRSMLSHGKGQMKDAHKRTHKIVTSFRTIFFS